MKHPMVSYPIQVQNDPSFSKFVIPKFVSGGFRHMRPVRIMVADDHEVVRRGLRALLEAQPDWQVCAEAADGRDVVKRAGELKPDVIVLDIAMPNLNGLEATRQLVKMDPAARVLILTLDDSEQLIRDVLSAGARGFLLKSDAARDLVSAVDALRQEKTYFTSKVASMVLNGFLDRGSGASVEPSVNPLTSREREVVQLLAEGKSTKEVACVLNLSVKTAETHRSN
ncbi:MAG TPA: response regulator transcription factor, partial [Terriglobales bacterium]